MKTLVSQRREAWHQAVKLLSYQEAADGIKQAAAAGDHLKEKGVKIQIIDQNSLWVIFILDFEFGTMLF